MTNGMSDNVSVDQNQPPAPPSASMLRKWQKTFWIYLIITALGIASLGVYALFFRNRVPQATIEGDIKITMNLPQSTVSGSESLLEVRLENLSNTKLTNLNLEVFYPRGFVFLESTPDPVTREGRQFAFADLPAGESYSLVLIGRLEGSPQEVKTVKLKLHYVPENFRSTFIAEAEASTILLAPDLSLLLTAPPQVIVGQTMSYEIKVGNISTGDFQDFVVRLLYPAEFEFISAIPDAVIEPVEKKEWKIASLIVGETVSIKVSGMFRKQVGGELFTQADFLIGNTEGDLVTAGRSFAFTQVRPSPLVLRQELISSSSDQVRAGEVLQYRVSFENTSDVALQNVRLTMRFDTAGLDFSKLNSREGQFRDNSLLWFSPQISALREVNPGERGEFIFSVPVAADLAQRRLKNPFVSSIVEYTAQEIPQALSGKPLDLKIATAVRIDSSITQISGSKPLKNGEPTTYRVSFALSNTVNDVIDATLTATMPRAEAEFRTDKVAPADEQKNVSFNPATGVIRWNLGKLFALTGTFHEARRLILEITIVPSFADQNQNPVILKNISVTGRDDFLDQAIVAEQVESLLGL